MKQVSFSLKTGQTSEAHVPDALPVVNAGLPADRARTTIAKAFADLPLDVRTTFASQYVIAERFLDLGQWDVAISLLQSTQVPADLDPVKQQFISALTAAKR